MASQSQLMEDFEIRSLVTRERYYKDTFQWDNWRNTYHPDSNKTWIDIAWISGTIDKFVAESKKMVDRVSSTHFIQPVDVQRDGDKALATSYGNINLRFTDQGNEYDLVSWGWWIHRAIRVDGFGWRLLAMRFIYDRDSITPTRPLSGAPLQIQLDPEARNSYKHLDWVLTQKGYEISKILAGTDDPSSVKRLRSQEELWLGTKDLDIDRTPNSRL